MLYKLKKLFGNFVLFKLILIDCYINLYEAFTNEFSNMKYCSKCNKPHYKFDKLSENLEKARKRSAY